MMPRTATATDDPLEPDAPAPTGLIALCKAVHSRENINAKNDDFCRLSSVTLLMTGLLFNCFIIWDYAVDPVHAGEAVVWRLLGSAILLVTGALGWQDTRALRTRLAAVIAPLCLLAVYIHILGILDNGAVYGVGGFLYFFIFIPFIAFAQPLALSIFIQVAIAVFPPLAAQFGLDAGLDWGIYNAYVWLAFTPVAVLMLTMDILYLRMVSYRSQALAQAMKDGLTQVSNRRHFNLTADQRLQQHRARNEPLSLLFIDIDHFKAVNDEYNHAIGDRAIRHVATTLSELIRDQDILGRYGGEEFVVLLTQTDADTARAVAERMRIGIANTPLTVAGATHQPIALTISVGIATCAPGFSRHRNLDAFIHDADLALYQAKKQGRNRVVSAADCEPLPRAAAAATALQ